MLINRSRIGQALTFVSNWPGQMIMNKLRCLQDLQIARGHCSVHYQPHNQGTEATIENYHIFIRINKPLSNPRLWLYNLLSSQHDDYLARRSGPSLLPLRSIADGHKASARPEGPEQWRLPISAATNAIGPDKSRVNLCYACQKGNITLRSNLLVLKWPRMKTNRKSFLSLSKTTKHRTRSWEKNFQVLAILGIFSSALGTCFADGTSTKKLKLRLKRHNIE